MPITIIRCLSHHCILEADNLFSYCIDPQMEMNFASGVLPIPNLDNLNNEIGTLELMMFE